MPTRMPSPRLVKTWFAIPIRRRHEDSWGDVAEIRPRRRRLQPACLPLGTGGARRRTRALFVYTINPDAARDALFHAERLFNRIVG